jgi:hypothetical protein
MEARTVHRSSATDGRHRCAVGIRSGERISSRKLADVVNAQRVGNCARSGGARRVVYSFSAAARHTQARDDWLRQFFQWTGLCLSYGFGLYLDY